MLSPRRTKYRKQQKGRAKGIRSNSPKIAFGKFAIRSLESCRLRSSTIEAVRRTITRALRRNGQVWVRIYPDLSFTTKPLEVRMGKGKGSPDYWGCRVKVGQTLFEIDGVTSSLARQAALLAHSKMPIRTTFVERERCRLVTCPSPIL